MKRYALLVAGGILLLSGCAGVKSSFDCNTTTTDNCMTMLRANQLARQKSPGQQGIPASGVLPALVNLPAPAPTPASGRIPVPARVPGRVPVPPRTPVPSPVSVSQSAASPVTEPAVEREHFLFQQPVSGARRERPSSSSLPAGPELTSFMPSATFSPSCRTVRCDNPGTVHPQRTPERVGTLWIAPWVDSDNVFHQPGRVSFLMSPAEWMLPTRIR